MAETPQVRVIPADFVWFPAEGDPQPVAVNVAKDMESGAARLHIFTAAVPPMLLGTLHIPVDNIDDLCGFLWTGHEPT